MAISQKLGSESASMSDGVSDTYEIGTVLQYDDGGDLLHGVVVGLRKGKTVALNERGREVELVKNRIYALPGPRVNLPAAASERVASISSVAKQVMDQSTSVDVPEIWVLFRDDVRQFTTKELSESYFGSDSQIRHGGLRLALLRDRIHFKRERDTFEPRSPEVVEGLKHQEELKHVKELLRKDTASFLLARLKEPSLDVPDKLAPSLRLLAEVAAGVQHSELSIQREAKDLLELCVSTLKSVGIVELNGTPDRQAFNALVAVGYLNSNTSLPLIRFGIPIAHSSDAIKEAQGQAVFTSIDDYPPDVKLGREDLTNAFSFTVDDITTKDMDDAISFEQTVEGFELGIHISDVSSMVPADSALDRSAKHRATSLYCADRTINMFPDDFTEHHLSLTEGVVRPCLSCILTVSDRFEIVSTRVVRSFIRSRKRYTYEDVDQLLEEGDPTLLSLHEFATMCEEKRIRNGALKVQKREVIPRLTASGKIELQELEEDNAARSLVAEMMVLGNSVFADFAREKKLPVLFRGQQQPVEGLSRNEADAPEGPAKDFVQRSKLKKSTTGLQAVFHAGLGLSAYIQATSPIRRYMDLCHQRQLSACLLGKELWHQAEQFQEIVDEVENHVQHANLASRETRRFWLLKYLEQRGLDKTISGTIVRTDLKLPIVELDEVYFTAMVKTNKRPAMGDRLELKITLLDPHFDVIRLEQV